MSLDNDSGPIMGQYEAREDFRSRDRAALSPGQFQIYRNGDIRAHVEAWSAIDKSLGRLLRAPGFRPIESATDYAEWVRFKLESIARFYEAFSVESIIGGRVDALVISRSGVAELDERSAE